jgi:branched-chain amino acid transport system permease protein
MASTSRLAVIAALVLLACAPLVLDRHVIDHLVFAAIFAIGGLGVSLLLGQCGILNMAQALFFGIGAFSSAILSTHWGISAPLNMMAGVGLSILIAVLIGWPILRLSGFFLALATLAVSLIGTTLFLEWDGWTGGELGVSGIPKLQVFGILLDTPARFFYLAWAAAMALLWLAANLVRGRTGLAMRAMRDAPAAAQVLGVDMHRLKVFMFAASAALGSFSGSLFAYYVSFVNYSSFTVDRAIMFLLIPVVAGAHSVWGVLLGALFITIVPEWLSGFGDIHRVLFGMALVLVVTLLPDGLMGLLARLRGNRGSAA